MEPRRLPLDAARLLDALTARDEGLLGTYLDLRSGELLRLYEPAIDRDHGRVEARLDEDPDRYARVPQYSREFRLMLDFVDTVEDDDLARLLDATLSGREAFRRFDGVLAGRPERKRWEAYRRSALTRWAAAWLRSLGIEPDGPLAVVSEQEPVPPLLALALDGAPDGRGGRVWQAADEDEARRLFVQVARQLAELRAEPFRARAVRDRTRFVRGPVELRRDGLRVVLSIRGADGR